MVTSTAIALIVRQKENWPKALRAGRAWQRAGATVSLFFVCNHLAAFTDETIESMVPVETNKYIRCCTNDPVAACQLGLTCMSIADIAQCIQQADAVIPF